MSRFILTTQELAFERLSELAQLRVELAEISNRHDNDKFELAIHYGSLGLAQYYLDKGLSPHTKLGLGWPAFHSAVIFANINIMRLFHQRGMDINLIGDKGQNIAHICIGQISLSIKLNGNSARLDRLLTLLKMVVAWGVDLTQKNDQGKTPLEICSGEENIKANQLITAAIEDAKTNGVTFESLLPEITPIVPDQLPLSDNDYLQIADYFEISHSPAASLPAFPNIFIPIAERRTGRTQFYKDLIQPLLTISPQRSSSILSTPAMLFSQATTMNNASVPTVASLPLNNAEPTVQEPSTLRMSK